MNLDLAGFGAAVAIVVSIGTFVLSVRKQGSETRLIDAELLDSLRKQIEALSKGLDEERRVRRILEDKLEALDDEYRQMAIDMDKLRRGTERLILQLRRNKLEPVWVPDSMKDEDNG